MRTSFALILVGFALMGVACTLTRTSPKPAPSTAVGRSADIARSTERQAVAERDSLTVAAVQALRARVPDLSDESWNQELDLILSRYKDVKPQQQHVDEAILRVSAWADGRVAFAQEQVKLAQADSDIFFARYIQEKNARIEAEKSEEASRAASERETKRLQKVIDDQNNAMMRLTARLLVFVGIGFIVAGGVSVFLSANKLGALKSAVPASVLGLIFCGLAQLVTRPWFMTACIIASLLIVATFAWWGYRAYRAGQLRQEVEAKAKKLHAVASDLVGGIHDVRRVLKKKGSITLEEADSELREWITETDGRAADIDELRREQNLIK